jgi:hypothetical protein
MAIFRSTGYYSWDSAVHCNEMVSSKGTTNYVSLDTETLSQIYTVQKDAEI